MKKSATLYTRPSHLSLSFLLTLGLVILLYINLRFAQVPSNTFSQLSEHPSDALLHQRLAQEYVRAGKIANGQKELTLAKASSLKPISANVLGIQTEINTLENSIILDPSRFLQKEKYWLDLVGNYPQFSDGWIQLMYTSLEAGNHAKAQEYLNRLYEFHPQRAEEVMKNISLK